MENKNYKILSIIFLSEFAITLLIFFFIVLLFLFNISVVAKGTDTKDFLPIIVIYGVVTLVYLLFMMSFGIAGYKLYNNKSGAKGWGIVASVFSLFFFFPLGIIISIIGFVLLLSSYENTYSQYQNQNPQNYYPPNNQQNWH